MAESIYTITMCLCIVLPALACAIALMRLFAAKTITALPLAWVGWALALGVLALLSGSCVHLFVGHGSAPTEPMDLTRFLKEHKAYLLSALLIVAAFLLIRARKK